MKAKDSQTGQFKNLYVKALDGLPVGASIEFAGTTIPDELRGTWMFERGQELSRTEYAKLFSVIGTSYGVGDGSTTFNLPNKCGRVPVGLDENDTDFNTIGKTGGSKYLEEHYHEGLKWGSATGQDVSLNGGSGGIQLSYTGGVQHDAKIYTATAGTGDSGNLQPYIVKNYIIKVKETRPLTGHVVNAYSESESNTYSSDYINKAFGGVVLWENSSPASGFIGQSITLSSGDYNYFEIYFRTFTGQDRIKSIRFQKGQNGLIDCIFKFGNDVFAGLRNFDYTDATHITFGDGEKVIQNNVISTGIDNGWVIPVKIIGYK